MEELVQNVFLPQRTQRVVIDYQLSVFFVFFLEKTQIGKIIFRRKFFKPRIFVTFAAQKNENP